MLLCIILFIFLLNYFIKKKISISNVTLIFGKDAVLWNFNIIKIINSLLFYTKNFYYNSKFFY